MVRVTWVYSREITCFLSVKCLGYLSKALTLGYSQPPYMWQTLHGGATHSDWALPVHATFSAWPWPISRSQQVKQFWLKILCSCQIKLKLCSIVKYTNCIMIIPLFLCFAHVQGRQFMYVLIWQRLQHWLSWGHCSSKFFPPKWCMIVTLLGVYQLVPGLMTLALFKGHQFVTIITANQVAFFRFLSTVV